MRELLGFIEMVDANKEELKEEYTKIGDLFNFFKPEIEHGLVKLQEILTKNRTAAVRTYEKEGFTTDQAIALVTADTNLLKKIQDGVGGD